MAIDEFVDWAKSAVKFVTGPGEEFDLLDRLNADNRFVGYYAAFETKVTDELAKGNITEQEAATARKTLEDARRGIKDALFVAVSAYAAQGNISYDKIRAYLENKVPQYRIRAKVAGRRAEQVLTLSREDVDRVYTFAKAGFEHSAEILAQNREKGLQERVTRDDVMYIVRQAMAEAFGVSYDATTEDFVFRFSVRPVSGSFEAGKKR